MTRVGCAVAFVPIALACSASQSATSPDAAATPPAREPAVHRAAGATCDPTRPAGVVMQGGTSFDCTKDADCTKGTNGRCNSSFLSPASKCTYDACARDSDCGSASACLCRDALSDAANVCVHGSCVTDSDCAGDYCSPSGLPIDLSCRSGLSPAQFGYFCHAAADECRDDADCHAAGPSSQAACVFSVDKLHWVCVAPACTG